jgi:hypothetical protein
MRFYRHVFQPTAVEDPAVSRAMLLIRIIQTGRIHIEGVGILHGELAHAQQAALGPRLIAEFRLDLVPDLRKLFVTSQQAARDAGHHLLVSHPQTQLSSESVFQAKQVVAHRVPAAGFPPNFRRIQCGQMKFLGADRVHLLAHNGGDLQH